MKKFVTIILALVLAFALSVAAFANPGQNPNRNPGSPEVQVATITITATGGGNNLILRAINADGVVQIIPRQGNGTFTQTFEAFGYSGTIRVQGNSLREVTITGWPAPPAPARYIVDEYAFYQFVDLNQVASKFTGTSEVAGSRTLVGLNVSSTFVEVNFSHIPDSAATGSGVLAGFTASGTLNYQFVRNYLEQFERIYEWVDVTVWSDGARDEVVREDSEHVRGDLEDGDEYTSDPFDASRAISATGDNTVRLTRGGGQGYLRGDAISGAFTVGLYIANQSPRVDVTSVAYDIDAL